jgi:hypothetical protein
MAKIYHYTTIDTLALIMLNKTIRFNRLDDVDDKEEALFGSGPSDLKISRNVFVTCWTKDPEKNPDLWQRYGNGGKGVRIALDEDMFQTYKINDHFKSFFPEWFKVIEDCVFILPLNEAKLYEVKYVEDNEERIKKAITKKSDYMQMKIEELGKYKKKDDWEQQGECRFRLFAFPSTKEASGFINTYCVNNMCAAMDTFKTLLLSNHQIELDHYDMPLKKGALDAIEVMMGPDTTKEDKSKVRRILYPCYVSRFFSNRRIVDSRL